MASLIDLCLVALEEKRNGSGSAREHVAARHAGVGIHYSSNQDWFDSAEFDAFAGLYSFG